MSAASGLTVFTRACLITLGMLSVAWGVFAFPAFWLQAPFDRLARQIIRGESFKLESLVEREPDMNSLEQQSICRPGLRSLAIVRLHILELLYASAQGPLIDSHIDALRSSILLSLRCSPADPFLWLILYWLENTRSGFSPDHLQYLRLSYKLGPNEGWIAAKRNPIVLTVFERLPPDLADRVVSEFAGLIRSGLYEEGVAILTGPGWRIRAQLLDRLKELPQDVRSAFAKRLQARGYDIEVPGVDRRQAFEH